jgi:hypothetical protein
MTADELTNKEPLTLKEAAAFTGLSRSAQKHFYSVIDTRPIKKFLTWQTNCLIKNPRPKGRGILRFLFVI